MVVIHVKKTELDQFLYETTVDASGDEIIRDLVNIWNNRLRIQNLAGAVAQLAAHGPAKHPEKKGIDHIQEQGGERIEKGPNYAEDPLGERTGNSPGPQLADVLEKVCKDALQAIDKNNVAMRVPLSSKLLQEKIDNIRGGVTMAYPMGLPEWDSVRVLLEEDPVSLGAEVLNGDILDPKTAQLWWAGKKLFRDQKLRERVGKNEKTKVIAKLQKPNAGPPAREPGISEEEQKAMMAYYFKKQEEMKQLAEADDDDYLHSSWSNPSALKNQLRGTGSIKPF